MNNIFARLIFASMIPSLASYPC